MIILFSKTDGIIKGVTLGRVHTPQQLEATIESSEAPEGLDKIIVQWVQTAEKDSRGNPIWKMDVAPEDEELYLMLENNPALVYTYKVNLETEKLIPI